MYVFYLYVCVLVLHVSINVWKPEASIMYLEAGVIYDYELLGRCWDLNLDPLQELKALLSDEPFLQPQQFPFLK